MAQSGKKTENGRLYFGDKTAEYLKKKSRQAVENYHNAPILYFGIDWVNSKRNFYGEMTVKKFANPLGVPVKGIYKINQSEASKENGLPKKSMTLTVSLYVDLLTELNIDPAEGDYFGIGNRFYKIYSRTTDDVGPGSLMMNRGKIRRDFLCLEEDDEALQKNPYGANAGLESQSNPETDVI